MLRVSVPGSPTDPLPPQQLAVRLGQFVEYYKLKHKSYVNLSKLSGVSENTIRSWSHILELNPNASNLPNTKLLRDFCYALGWTLTDLFSFLEGDEPLESVERRLSEGRSLLVLLRQNINFLNKEIDSTNSIDEPVESVDGCLLESDSLLDQQIDAIDQEVESANHSEINSTNNQEVDTEADIAFHLLALARLTGASQFFRLPSVIARRSEKKNIVMPDEKFIHLSPYANERLRNLIRASARERNWSEKNWEEAGCDMELYRAIFDERVFRYDFTLEGLKTLTPHLYEVVSWTGERSPLLNTSATYGERTRELIDLLENGNGRTMVSTS